MIAGHLGSSCLEAGTVCPQLGHRCLEATTQGNTMSVPDSARLNIHRQGVEQGSEQTCYYFNSLL